MRKWASKLAEPLAYYKEMFYRAIKDTCHFSSWNLRNFIFLLLYFIGWFIYGQFHGWRLMMEEYIKWLYVVFTPIGGFFLLLFFINLFIAPFKLSKKQKQKISETEKELNKYKNPTCPIRIDYNEDDSRCFHDVSSLNRSGQHHRIILENLTGETIDDISIQLTDMRPLHAVFERQIPLTLEEIENLNPGQEPVAIVMWTWHVGTTIEDYAFITEHATLGNVFRVDDIDYEIELTVRGRNIQPISKRFQFGITRIHGLKDKFWFRSLE